MTIPGLLVSVRDAHEAEAAIQGGVSLIDVKEPVRGSLGRADDAVISEIVRQVDGRLPVSAAMGELHEGTFDVPKGVAFAKWGLAEAGRDRHWEERLDELRNEHPAVEIVTVGYADWQCAKAPPLDAVADYACDREGVFLIDTCCKDANGQGARPTLLDWIDLPWLLRTATRCRMANVRLALAGSLTLELIRRLAPLRPDWFAVRGAACEGQDRSASVTAGRVAALVRAITSVSWPHPSGSTQASVDPNAARGAAEA